MSQLKVFTIWSLVDPGLAPVDHSVLPKGLDYVKGLITSLHPKEDWDKGVPVLEQHYREYDGDSSYDGLEVQCDFSYEFNEKGDPLVRTKETRWMQSDGNLGAEAKVEVRKYNKVTSRRAGRKRRKNVISNLIDQSEVFNATADFNFMFESISKDVQSYERTGNTKLIQSVQQYEVGTQAGAWLEDKPFKNKLPAEDPREDLTLRHLIMGALAL